MTKRKFFSVLLILTFLCSFFNMTAAADSLNEQDSVPAPPELDLDVKAAYLMDADTGEALYAMNADRSCYPASTTKIMTCYLALKYGSISDTVTLSSGIYHGISGNASTAGLKSGEVLTVYQLMQCMMIVSANEAANALAIYVSGSIDAFVELMNTEAEALGCTGTHFMNPNGLHDKDHYTTAADLAIIAQAAMQYDTFRAICSTTSAEIPATNLSDARTLVNTNELLIPSEDSEYYYAEATGIKTGYTTPAGYCLVSSAAEDGRTLIGVILGAKKTGEDSDAVIESFPASKRLLSWGFENYTLAIQYQKYLQSLPEETEEDAEDASEDEAETSSADDDAEDDVSAEEDSAYEAEPESDYESSSCEELSPESDLDSTIEPESAYPDSSLEAEASSYELISAIPESTVSAPSTDANAEPAQTSENSANFLSDSFTLLIAGAVLIGCLLILVFLLILIRRRKR